MRSDPPVGHNAGYNEPAIFFQSRAQGRTRHIFSRSGMNRVAYRENGCSHSRGNPRFSAGLLEQVDILNLDRFVQRLRHVVDGECSHVAAVRASISTPVGPFRPAEAMIRTPPSSTVTSTST